MSDPQDPRDPEAVLRAHYAATDPGPVPADFVRRVEAGLAMGGGRNTVTFTVARVVRPGRTVRLGFVLATGAAAVIVAVGIAGLLGLHVPSLFPATGTSPAAPSPALTPTASGSAAGHPSGFPSDPAAMAFFDADHGLVVGEVGGDAAIWRTADGGGTWALTVLDMSGGRGVAVEGTHAWASVGTTAARFGAGIFESTDEGMTWTQVSGEEIDSLSFVDDQHGFAIRTAASETTIAASSDGGRGWAPVAAPQPCGSLTAGHPHPVAVSFVSESHGWVLCEAWTDPNGPEERGVAETTDGGATWQWVVRVTPTDSSDATTLATPDLPTGMAMRADGSGLISCLGGCLLRTDDGGRTWRNLAPAPFTHTVQPWIIASAGSAGPWFALRPAGDPPVLERSDDGGRTWSTVATGPRATPAPTPVAPPNGTPGPSPA